MARWANGVGICKVISALVFFFKLKTAYEMRISDWSSDVCFSDLVHALRDQHRADLVCFFSANADVCGIANIAVGQGFTPRPDLGFSVVRVSCATEIGSAACRERGCEDVEISGVAGSLKKKNTIIYSES